MDKKYTLITGGTEGIGFELAKLYGKNKENLILVARDENKLKEKKNILENDYKVEVLTLSVDLSLETSCKKIIKFVDEKNIIVDKLINNAGNLNNKMEFEMMDNKILCDIETKNYKGEVVIIIQGNSYEYIFMEKD